MCNDKIQVFTLDIVKPDFEYQKRFWLLEIFFFDYQKPSRSLKRSTFDDLKAFPIILNDYDNKKGFWLLQQALLLLL